jgi:hypothetical protein
MDFEEIQAALVTLGHNPDMFPALPLVMDAVYRTAWSEESAGDQLAAALRLMAFLRPELDNTEKRLNEGLADLIDSRGDSAAAT